MSKEKKDKNEEAMISLRIDGDENIKNLCGALVVSDIKIAEVQKMDTNDYYIAFIVNEQNITYFN